jgi:superkiller protein 3
LKDAAAWFDEGMKAIGLSRHADYGSEYRDDLESAVAAFDEALGLEPDHLGALRERALALAQLGQHEAALDSFVAAAAQAKTDPALFLAAAQSLVKLHRHDEALKSFDQVLHLRPGDAEALFGRSDALMALRDFTRALPAWDEVLRAPDNKTLTLQGRTVRVLTADFRRTHARLSRALALGQLERLEAMAAFREVLNSEADQLFGMTKPGAFIEALETLEVARAAFRAWIDEHASDPSTWRRAADTWLEAGRTDEALAARERLISDAKAWFEKAETHVQGGQLDLAIAAYERALDLWPGFSDAASRMKLVKAQRDAGRWKVMGRDTFAREDFVVGEFATKAEAEARITQLEERTAKTQDESLRDSFWLESVT